MVFILDMDGRVLKVNNAVLERLNYTDEEIESLHILDMLPPDRRDEAAGMVKEMIEGKTDSYHIPLATRDSEIISVEIKISFGKWNGQEAILGICRDISERVKVEEKYRYVIEHISDLIMVVEADGTLLYASPQIHDLLGFAPSERIGLRTLKFVHPDDLPNLVSATENAYKTGQKINVEYRTLHKDGRYIHVSAKGAFRDNGRFYGVIRDISERKRIETKLKESEEKYRLISDNANDIISVFDENFKLEYVNDVQSKISGFSKEEIIERSPMEFIHPDDFKKAVKLFRITFKIGIGHGEFRMRCKNGSYAWLEVSGKRIYDKNNKARLILISRDISEKKMIEQKLKDSEEKYRLISENANDLIRVLDDKFEFVYVNEKVHKRLLGYKKEDLIGKPHIQFFHPDDAKHAVRSTYRNLKKGYGSYQARFRDKAGNFKWLEFAGKLFYDGKGEKKILSIARDINDRKIAEQNLMESEKKYHQAYDQASVYKDIIAHDMNNILHSIQSSLELCTILSSKSQDVKDFDEWFQIIQSSVDKGARLIRNVQKLSRVDEASLSLAPVEVLSELRKAISFLGDSFRDKKVEIQLEALNQELRTHSNELLIEIFENILINAVKYNFSDTIEITIKVSEAKEKNGEWLKIEFIDNGIGIPDENKKLIFKKGFKKDMNIRGMGIGLSLVNKIVKSYGGKIWVENRISGDHTKGSNFVVLLPKYP